MRSYGHCDRCDSWSHEYLDTHSHCWECDRHSINDDYRQWADLEFGKRNQIRGFQIRPNIHLQMLKGGAL